MTKLDLALLVIGAYGTGFITGFLCRCPVGDCQQEEADDTGQAKEE